MEIKPIAKPQQVLIAAVGINILLALLYIWSIISKELIIQYNWSSKQASLPYTASTIFTTLAMVLFGRFSDSKGPRFIGTIGAILQGGGLILSGFTMNPVIMALTFGGILGLGGGFLTISATPTPAKWFPASKGGLITGLVSGGVGIASIIYSPLANKLLSTVGISHTFIYIGIPVLILMFIFCQFLANPPENYSKNISSIEKRKVQPTLGEIRDIDSGQMVKTLSFYQLWFMMVFASSAGLMIIGHAANIARVQIHWEGGFLLVMLLGVFNATGRLLGGSISDRIGRINLLRIIFALQATNMLLFTRYNSILLLAIGVATAGFCYGCNFSVFPATLVDLYGKRNFSSNFGTLYTAWGIAGIIGPMIAAAFIDATGSYNGAYFVAFGLMSLSFIVTFLFHAPKIHTTQIPNAPVC